MARHAILRATLVAAICCTMLTGCLRGRRGSRTTDVVRPQGMDSDLVLSDRFEDGTRVRDVEFDTVLFGYDSFQVQSSEVAKIEKVAEYMRRNRDTRLIAEGHCDERGSREYNMSLGEHRGLAVRAYLIGLGIDHSRIQTRSYGEERPADPGHDENAWRLNRRVEFPLYR